MAFTEDLDAFFRLKADGGLADAGTYDGATAVAVHFGLDYVEAFNISGTGPMAVGKASDFPLASAAGKTLLVNGTTYTIKSQPEPFDDGAFVVLRLKL